MKLNIGCGLKYLQTWTNIDGSSILPKIDQVIQLPEESLLDYFDLKSAECILMEDFLEHHFRWEAIKILDECYSLLCIGGCLELELPDFEAIVNSKSMSIETKLLALFGGQDIPQGNMDDSRKLYPEFFCHKYSWTQAELHKVLTSIGFKDITFKSLGTNMRVFATKPS